MTHSEVMPGKQNYEMGFNDYRGLSTTLPLYHTAGKIDSKNKMLDEVGEYFWLK
ncbi:MAG: hypothetical protein ACYDCJ_04160 [Gammaproteobacteria bacterium]